MHTPSIRKLAEDGQVRGVKTSFTNDVGESFRIFAVSSKRLPWGLTTREPLLDVEEAAPGVS